VALGKSLQAAVSALRKRQVLGVDRAWTEHPTDRLCETRPMRLSDFWRLMDDEFGAAYARSLARDHVLGALGNRTPLQALESGVKPREAWLALCADMDVPVERRLGKELRDHTKEARDRRQKG